MKNLKKCLALIAVLAIIGSGVYVIPNEMKACNKCVIDINRGIRKCKCGGFMNEIKQDYDGRYLYLTYKCKICGHKTSIKIKK